jgi:hypothetical protein
VNVRLAVRGGVRLGRFAKPPRKMPAGSFVFADPKGFPRQKKTPIEDRVLGEIGSTAKVTRTSSREA